MTYLWAYGEEAAETAWSLTRPVFERPLILDTSYEVDLWGDNPDHPTRWHDIMDTTMNSRTYTCARLRLAHVWMDDYYRRCRQLPGKHDRGPAQAVRYLNNHGPEYEDGAGVRFAHSSWKKQRATQYRVTRVYA